MRYLFLGLIGFVLLFGSASPAAVADQSLIIAELPARGFSTLQEILASDLFLTDAQQQPDVQDLTAEIPATGKCVGKFNVKIQNKDAELCGAQYKVNVPEEAFELWVELEKGGKFDMAFALAPKDPIGTPDKNFFIFNRQGKDVFDSEIGLLDRDSNLETGPWFIAVLNYEEKERTFNVIGSATPVTLKSGQPYEGSIIDNTFGGRKDARTGVLGFVDYTIRVPNGAKSLTIETKTRTGGDIDLFARLDKPVDVDRSGLLADHGSDSDGGDEKIVIDEKSKPALKAGVYYIKIGNFESTRQRFTLTATLVADQAQPQAPTIQLSPSALTFNANVGSNPTSQSFQIANSGGGTLNWKASVDQPWVSLSSSSGTAPSTVNVSVNTSGLAAGTQKAKITLTGDGASNSPQTLEITLNLTQAQQPTQPVLQVKPGSLTFNATVNGANPAAQNLEITNGGGGALNWTAVADVSWLTLSANSGAAPANVSVNVNITGLAAGTVQGRIIVSAQGASGSPQLISVTLNIAPPATTTGQVFAVRFARIEFPNPEKWEKTVKEGCVVYKNISNGLAGVRLVLNNGSRLDVDIPANKEVIVCGTIAHIDTRP
jgi:hypothetical protein